MHILPPTIVILRGPTGWCACTPDGAARAFSDVSAEAAVELVLQLVKSRGKEPPRSPPGQDIIAALGGLRARPTSAGPGGDLLAPPQ